MKLFLIIGLLFAVFYKLDGKADWDVFNKHHLLIKSQGIIDWKPCRSNRDVVLNFRQSHYNFSLPTFIKIATVSDSHFVYSPYSLWAILGAISEGTTGRTREELLEYLLLPQDECLRNQYYQLANTLEPASEDVTLSRSSMLILDDSVNLNGYWENFSRTKTLLRTSSAPIKSDPAGAADLIRKIVKLQLPTPNFDGNSVIIDTLNFEGLWTNAFSDAIVERAPFYDDLGKKVGYVDLMKIKRRAKMTYIPSMNTKVLELPVGFGGRYKMLFGINLGTTEVKDVIPAIMNLNFFEVLATLKESIIPLDIAIPRFRMTTEIDMREILEEMGVRSLWTDPEGTRNISEPAALPSSFIQRTTITLDTTGVQAPIQEIRNIVVGHSRNWVEAETGLDPILGRDFIADRPLMFGLFDSKTYTTLFSAIFSSPTYKL